MLSQKSQRMLTLLDAQIQSCERCNLYVNGRAKPFWTSETKYAMGLEAPSKEEIENNEPIIGKTGRFFWDLMSEFQFLKKMFLIFNSANCRVLNGNKNGKPSEYHRDCCRDWNRKYLKIVEPKKLILFGNYAIHTITGEWGVSKLSGTSSIENIFGIDMEVIRCYHPSSVIYDKSKEESIRECIQKLKE